MKRFKTWLGFLSVVSIALAGINATPLQAQTPAAVSEGNALLQKGWVNPAIAAFQRALQQNPRSLEARLGLAIAYQRAGQDAKAWQAYQQVLELGSKNKTALAALGTLGAYRPEWQATGITALTQLLQITPNDQEARSQRALLLGYQGRFTESLADYQSLLQQNPKPKVILDAAQIYSYSGNYAQALKLFERYLSLEKFLPVDAAPAYARSLQETGNPAQAVQILEAYLKQSGSKPSLSEDQAIALRATLAQAYQANGQPEAGLEALALLRNQPKAILPLARVLSAIARKAGDAELYRQSVDLYQQALSQTPNPSPGLITEVADVLSEVTATRSQALTLYQQLIQQQPNQSSLKIKQLILANQLGQITRAEMQSQLTTILQSLAAGEQRESAIALIRLDDPDPTLLPLYQNLQATGVDVPFLDFRIAQMLLQKGDLAGAKQALANYGKTPEGARDLAGELLLAEIDRRESRLDQSASRYEAVIARNPSIAVTQDALFGLMTIRRSQGRLAEMVPFYTSLLARDPQNARTKIGFLNLNYQARTLSLSEAETQLDQWLATQSTLQSYPELLSLVAALPADAKREALYTKLLELEPDSIGVETRLIQVIALRDPVAARSRVQQIVDRDRTNINNYFLQGEVARSLGDLSLAAEAYQTILQQQPEHVDALSALAGVRFEQKHYQEAEALYRQILVLRPKDLTTNRILVDLYQAQDHPLAAFRQLQLIQASQPEPPMDAEIAQRIQDAKLNYLRRRGFQPYWERY